MCPVNWTCNPIRCPSLVEDCRSCRDANDSPMLDRILLRTRVPDAKQQETNNPLDLYKRLVYDEGEEEHRRAWNTAIENGDSPSVSNVEDERRENVNVVDLPWVRLSRSHLIVRY